MGKFFSCLQCECTKTKVIPLEILPEFSDKPLPGKDDFHRTVQNQWSNVNSRGSPQNLSREVTICSSLATISLGSKQSLPLLDCLSTEGEAQRGHDSDSSPSSKRHPGLFIPEPNESQIDPSKSPAGKDSRDYNCTLPQMMDGYPRHSIPIENGHQRVCIHGIPLGGINGDPHKVDCTLCERPGSKGGRALAGMVAFRRAQSKKSKSGSLLQSQKLTEEQEKMRKTTEEYDKALRKFAERHQNDD